MRPDFDSRPNPSESSVYRRAESSVYRQFFAVPFDYDVHFTRDVFRPQNRLLLEVLDRKKEERRHRVFVCIDRGLAEARADLVREVLDYFHVHQSEVELVNSPEIVPGGEAAKSVFQVVEDLMVALGNQHMDRQSYVMAIGGGSVLDMVGFVTALVHRGLRLVRLPTTVLAQNDAGVGVKNGMNEHGVKNFLGTFAPPFAVVNDFKFLTSLPDEHWLGGIAEALKVAIIKDRDFFDFLCDRAAALVRRDQKTMEELIRRCAILHLDHIASSGDPFEMGTARPLDFGHWSAHKLETLSEYRISHGHAVAAGIALDSYYASKRKLIKKDDLARILGAITESGLEVWYPEMDQKTASGDYALLRGLEEFREHLGGTLTITLPDGIGKRVEVHRMNEDWIEEGLFYLRSYAAEQRNVG